MRTLTALLLLLMASATLCPSAEPTSADAEKHFTLKVLPLLNAKCLACHGSDADDLKGDFDMRTRESLIRGGESEDPAVVPGEPDESPLFHAVRWDGLEMPPKENDRLSDEETEQIRRWIVDGAVWPSAERQQEIREAEWAVLETDEGIIIPTSGGLADDWTYRRYQPEDVWAFRPVMSKNELGVLPDGVHPVDYFVDAKLDEAGIKPAAIADPHTLIRRATYDLIGLPPKPGQAKRFQDSWNDNPTATWEAYVDRLLARPQYGERMAQHWLDVVRYADTSGFSNDYERSNAWRYRDYVIRSFNNDKPYDEFVMEQIAGDELRPGDAEAMIATGFLRMGPWGTAMIPREEARQLYLDDLVHNTGQTFLSMPMRCCKCHDHKFDPIPTRDYYRLYAAFATTQPAEMPAEFLPEENQDGFAANRELVEKLLALAKADEQRIVKKREDAARKWYAEHNLPYKDRDARQKDPEDQKPPRHVGLDHVDEGTLKIREQDIWIWNRRLERFEPMVQSVYNGSGYAYNGRKLRKPKKLDAEWRPESYIFAGGSRDAKSEQVSPGVLSGLGLASFSAKSNLTERSLDDASADEHLITDEIQGRRLELARWIAHPGNPMTARSYVNRVWQFHFGVGLAHNANNLGAKGAKPTHPKLLDWLTSDFIENGWKTKRLHRLIMTSKAYQRSAQHPDLERLENVDPDNKLLARFRPRRLSAEELRDTVLQTTGELNLEMGGVPIMPEINMEVALQPRMIQFSIAPAYQPSRTPDQRNRRTIYAYRIRGQADPFLEILNQPNPNESCEHRDSAAVSPQAFTLMNSDLMTDRSIAMALRIEEEVKADEARIRRAVRLAYGRPASKLERQSLTNYFAKMKTYHAEHKPKPVEYPTQITRSLVEEFSGKPFESTEWLPVFEDYVPDAKPWTVSSETRALADVCLVLMNANEFVYVY